MESFTASVDDHNRNDATRRVRERGLDDVPLEWLRPSEAYISLHRAEWCPVGTVRCCTVQVFNAFLSQMLVEAPGLVRGCMPFSSPQVSRTCDKNLFDTPASCASSCDCIAWGSVEARYQLGGFHAAAECEYS